MSNHDYKYYKDNNCLHRIYVENDPDPENPRYEDYNVGHLAIFWNRYSLGDNRGQGDFHVHMEQIAKTYVAADTITRYALENELSTHYEKQKDGSFIAIRSDGFTYDVSKDDIVDDILEEISCIEIFELLEEQNNIVILPCYIYEHGGLTISCGDYIKETPGYPFNDHFDSGMAGFIFTTLKDFEKNDLEWNKKTAKKNLKAEIKVYDMYLQNEIYVISDEQYDPDTGEWNFVDACGGYYSENYGDELLYEIASKFNGLKEEELFDTPEKAGFIRKEIVVNYTAERYILASA